MENTFSELSVTSVKAAFVDASICKIGDNLISYSVSISENKIQARIVVLQSIRTAEEENIMDILGDIVGHFPGVTADFQFVKIQGKELIRDCDALAVRLFQRGL